MKTIKIGNEKFKTEHKIKHGYAILKYKKHEIKIKIPTELVISPKWADDYAMVTRPCLSCGINIITIRAGDAKQKILKFIIETPETNPDIDEDTFDLRKTEIIQCKKCLGLIHHNNEYKCSENKEYENELCNECQGNKELSDIQGLLASLANTVPCHEWNEYKKGIKFETINNNKEIIINEEFLKAIKHKTIQLQNEIINAINTKHETIYETSGELYYQTKNNQSIIKGMTLLDNSFGAAAINERKRKQLIKKIDKNMQLKNLINLLIKYANNSGNEIRKIKDYLKSRKINDEYKKEILLLLAARMNFTSEDKLLSIGECKGDYIRFHTHPQYATVGPSIHDVNDNVIQAVIKITKENQFILTITQAINDKLIIYTCNKEKNNIISVLKQ